MSIIIRNRRDETKIIATVEDTDDLREAVIRLVKKGVDLRDADLDGANLYGADLTGANLYGANLTPVRDDLWAVLSSAPAEVPALIAALEAGHVNGSSYTGDCACLVGTIANARHCSVESLGALKPNADRAAERFFLAIKTGDTPDKSQFAKLARDWSQEWLSRMEATFGARQEATP